MQQEAETFVAPRLEGTNPAELFLNRAGDDDAAKNEIASFFDEASPETANRMLGTASRSGGARDPARSGR